MKTNFKIARIKKGLTQSEVSKAINSTNCTISRWENDATLPSVNVVLKLAELYGVSVDFLLGRE